MDLRNRRTALWIKTAFIDLLTEKKFTDLTITEISEYAHIQRQTFYAYYADKYALANTLYAAFEQEYLSLLQEFLQAETFLQRKNSFERLMSLITKNHLMLTVLFQIEEKDIDFKTAFQSRLISVHTSYSKVHSDFEARLFASIFYCQIDYLLHHPVSLDFTEFEQTVHHLLHTVAPCSNSNLNYNILE